MSQEADPRLTGIDAVDEIIAEVASGYADLMTAAELEAFRQTLATALLASPEGARLVGELLRSKGAAPK